MILPASAMPVSSDNSFIGVLDVVGNASFAVSSSRRLSSISTSPFHAGAGNTTNPSSPFSKFWIAGYDSTNQIDTANLTSELGTFNTGVIHTWYDQSGNGRNATRGGSAMPSYPAFFTSGFINLNGKLSSFYLPSNTVFASFSSITLNSEFSIFVVEDRNLTSQFGALIGATTSSPTNLSAGFGVWSDGNIYAFDSSGYLQIANTNVSARVLEFSKTGSTREVLQNGVLLSGTTVSQTRNNIISHVGRLDSGGVMRYTTGLISEVIIYNRYLTTEERNFVTNNIRTYYGV